MKHLVIALPILFFMSYSTSQNLSKHKWNHRIVIVISKKQDSKVFQNQINMFKESPEDFAERKLVVYYATPDRYKFIDFLNHKKDTYWIASSVLFEKYKDEKSDLKIVLIGLDGSVKLQQNSLITIDKLFATIDKMPMRRSEIRQGKN